MTTQPTSETEPTLRADARRNRDQIIAAAKEVFAEQGTDVPMEEVARAAGVGVGTLYRRFPDREALVVAVVRASVETLVVRLRDAVAQQGPAWDRLVESMSYSRELRLSHRDPTPLPMSTRMALRRDPGIRRLRSELHDLLGTLVDQAQQEGSLRPDVGLGDVILLFILISTAQNRGSDRIRELASARMLGVVLDGLRGRDGGSLPGHPLTKQDLEDD